MEADAGASGAAPSTAVLPQDLAMILGSGVAGTSAAAPAASSAAADSSDTLGGPSTDGQEKSLAEYRAAVAAARAQLDAARAGRSAAAAAGAATDAAPSSPSQAVPGAAAETPEVDGAQLDGAAASSADAVMLSGDAAGDSADDEGSPDIVEALTAAAPLPARKRRRIDKGGEGGSATSAAGSDQGSSDTDDGDSASDSDDSDSDDSSDSDSDESAATTTNKRGQRRRGPKAPEERVEKLPAWANEASDDDDDDDEDGGGGARTGAHGPTTKNEVSLAALTLEQPAVRVIPGDKPLHYLGCVTSIIGAVVVVEQDVRGSAGAGAVKKERGRTAGDGSEDLGHDVLDTGSLLAYSNRKVLGTIFETFGSVLQPMYTLRFASPDDIPSMDLPSVQKEEGVPASTAGAEEEDDEENIDGAPLDLDVSDMDAAAVVVEDASAASAILETAEPKDTKPTEHQGPEAPQSAPAATGPSTPTTPLTIGTHIYYAPTHANYVFTSQLRRLKGSDASNLFDEEIAEEEMEFSDDEAEAEARRRRKKGGGKSGRREAGEVGSSSGNAARSFERGRGRGQDRERGRGRGRGAGGVGRGRGGGMHHAGGLRHRDDFGGADAMMAASGGGGSGSSSSLTLGALPAGLPARPAFSYDFDNNTDVQASAAAAGGNGRAPQPNLSPGASRRHVLAPYDEPAGVVHTLALPVQETPSGQGAAGGFLDAASGPSKSRWDQRQARPGAASRGGAPAQAGAAEQTLPQDASGQQQPIAPHINPLFAQQWQQQQQQHTPYGQLPSRQQQQQQYAQQAQAQHFAQQQQGSSGSGGGWNGYYGAPNAAVYGYGGGAAASAGGPVYNPMAMGMGMNLMGGAYPPAQGYSGGPPAAPGAQDQQQQYQHQQYDQQHPQQ